MEVNTRRCVVLTKKSPKIAQYENHEWLHDMLHLEEHDTNIDVIKRQVFINFITAQQAATFLQLTALYEHTNGEMSKSVSVLPI